MNTVRYHHGGESYPQGKDTRSLMNRDTHRGAEAAPPGGCAPPGGDPDMLENGPTQMSRSSAKLGWFCPEATKFRETLSVCTKDEAKFLSDAQWMAKRQWAQTKLQQLYLTTRNTWLPPASAPSTHCETFPVTQEGDAGDASPRFIPGL